MRIDDLIEHRKRLILTIEYYKERLFLAQAELGQVDKQIENEKVK